MILSPKHFTFTWMTLFSIVHLLPSGILMFPLTWPQLSSNLAFVHEYLFALLQAESLACSPACCTGIHMGTGASICEKLGGNVEKVQVLKVWRRPAHYKLFWSTASSLFIENSKLFLMLFCCRDEPCPWAWSAFKRNMNMAWLGVRAPTEMAVPLVHIAPMLQWHSCEPLSLVGPREPITQPCKPGTTFTLTSSAPHSSEALPFRAA